MILLLRTTQNYNSVFPFISFYFAPDQKRATFACNGAHMNIINRFDNKNGTTEKCIPCKPGTETKS